MNRRLLRSVLAVVLFSAVACAPDAQHASSAVEDEGASLPGRRNDALRAAAERSGVPRQMLVAHAYVLGRLEVPTPEADVDEVHGGQHGHGHEQRLGWMQLEPAEVERAAALTGLSPEAISSDILANAEAAAALLDAYAREEQPEGVLSWEAWAAGAARVAGLTHPKLRDGFVQELLRVMAEGVDVTLRDGERVLLQPVPGVDRAGETRLGQLAKSLTAPGEYPTMSWMAAHPNNFIPGRYEGSIKYVIIHMTVGSYFGTLKWFAMPNPAYSSTQYVIRSSDGEITQMVNESDGSWHGGNTHYSMNSIGIEHEGNMPDPSIWYTEAMYQSSARLVCAIAKRHNIPVDRQHIIGHYQIPNGLKQAQDNPPGTDADVAADRTMWGGSANHMDPSYDKAYWNWDYYMQLIRDCVAASQTTSPLPRGYVTTTAPTPFHSAPGFAATAHASLPAGERVFVEAGPLESDWYQVLDAQGVRGFVQGGTLKPLQAQLIHTLPTTEKVVALTFDAGPERGYAEAVLDTLRTKQIKATFTVSGAWAEAHPDLALRMQREGHQLVSQGYSGTSFTGVSTLAAPLSYEERTSDLWRGHASLEKVTGARTKPFFFAPAGDTDPSVLTDAYSRGYDYVVRWFCGSIGTLEVTPADIVQRAVDYADVGTIYRFDMGSQSQDAAALPEVIRTLAVQGYRFVRISDFVPERPSPMVSTVRVDAGGSVFATIDGVERQVGGPGHSPVILNNRSVAYLSKAREGGGQVVQVFDARSGQTATFAFEADVATRLLVHPTTDFRLALIAEGSVGPDGVPVLAVYHPDFGAVLQQEAASFYSLAGDMLTVQRWAEAQGQPGLSPAARETHDLRALLGI